MSEAERVSDSAPKRVAVGRRVFLGLGALAAVGVVVGSKVQDWLSGAVGTGLGGILPFGDRFRIYSITGVYPAVSRDEYRLEVSGLVDRPTTFTLATSRRCRQRPSPKTSNASPAGGCPTSSGRACVSATSSSASACSPARSR